MQVLNQANRPAQPSPEYPLSQQQQGLWFLYQLAPDSTAYNIYHTVRILGEFDIDAWQQAWQQLFQAHPILRSRYLEVKGKPLRVFKSDEISLQQIQASDWSQLTLNHKIFAETAKPFRLETEPAIRVSLFQCSPKEFIQVITLHHIAGDTWTFDLLMQEWQQRYQSKSCYEPSSYTDYVQWQTQMLTSNRGQDLRNFWQKQLAGELPQLDLPSKSSHSILQVEQSGTQSFPMPLHLIEPLKAFAQAQGYSLYRILLTTFLVLLYRYTGTTDLTIGTAMAGRWGTPRFQETIGYFSNMLPLRVPMQGELEFETLLERVHQLVSEVQAHQDLPYQELVKQHKSSCGDLFSVTFTWQKQRWMTQKIEGLKLEPYLLEHQGGATFDLDLQVVEAGDRLQVVWQYNANRFEEDMITRMAQQFETLLEHVIQSPQAQICCLAILPEKEQRQLLVEWNATAQSFPQNCVHELIATQAAKTPDAIAIEFNSEHLTYRELEQRSNQLAHYLQTQGVRSESLVGICMARSIEFIIGILAILKAGGAFVPLDPTYPKERLALLISDAQVAVLLTQQHRIAEINAPVIDIALEQDKIQAFSSEAFPSTVKGNNLAYVIYTSGSTGRPKGVMIEHQSLINHNLAVIQEYELQQGDRVLQASALSFDIAIEEIFPTLICGARLVLRSPECLMSSQQFLKFVEAHQITVLNLPTALWHQIVQDLAELNLTLAVAVRLVIVGGEKVSRTAYLTWRERVGQFPRWLNTYGPTEATVITTLYDPVRSGFAQGELPIGSAIANTQTYVLDAHLQPVPIGVTGELWIGGAGVARGYLRRLEQTSEKFIEHQFPGLPPTRLYRTGDLVRYRPDGKLEYLGRNDSQIKIRGFRIELGEIEFRLNQHPAVKSAIVLAENQQLIAYVIAQDPTVEPVELQQFLKQALPSYMIPSAWVELAAFPLTANGKVDRNALISIVPSTRSLSRTDSLALPETELEQQLVQIWQEGLNVQSIGLDDDFFELGGHSLLMLRLVSKIEQILGKPIQVATLYQWRTIRQLAQVLEDEQADLSADLIQFQVGEPGRSPLFCIPGAMGTFRFCEGLRACLDSRQPIYGIQELTVTSETTLEAMADHAVQEMRRLQPQGPYYLVGYSMGSAVAYEIAQQLQAQGQKVALLALITPGNLIALPAMLSILQKLPGFRNAHLLLEVLTRWSAFPVESRSRRLRDRVLLVLHKVILTCKYLFREFWFSQTERSKAQLYRKYNRILDRYRPSPSTIPVQLFMSEEEIGLSDLWVSWRKLVEDKLTVHTLPGDHLSCVEKSSMQRLVTKIAHLLPKAVSH
jgi:amino acid adenylation domain-containing protein